jgi:hypothetical protein
VIAAPQPNPVAKNASFEAIDTSGQKTTEKAAAKTKNIAAMDMELVRRVIELPLSVVLTSFHSTAIRDS